MTHRVKQFDRHIESVLAALDLLDCFLAKPRFSIKDFVEETGMTRNRISRILGTLIHKGYIMESTEKGVYTTGPKLMALGNVFKNNQNLVVLARGILKELSLITGESATFYIRDGKERVVLAREEGTDAIRFSVTTGQRMDLHAGAAGKVILAFTPESERNILLSNSELQSCTDKTITDPALLQRELSIIRKQGYGVSRGERNPDAFSIAAPVFERDDQLIGAIALAGPISRHTPETEKYYLEKLLEGTTFLTEQFSMKKADQ